jgi:tRNA dimethylallyltransferase
MAPKGAKIRMQQTPTDHNTTSRSSFHLVVIAGATASGKTSVAIELAKTLNAPILSADSRQCYRELQIGTAAPSLQEMQDVPHYFVGSHSIHQSCSAADFAAYAENVMQEVRQKSNYLVVAGGTGLYLKALLHGLDQIPPIPEEVHQTLRQLYHDKGLQWLQETIEKEDPLFAADADMNNPVRLLRALEVIRFTGKSIRSFQKNLSQSRPFTWNGFVLDWPREELYERIHMRVDLMVEQGLEQEVWGLKEFRHLDAMQTVGYREWFDFFDGNISREEAIDLIKKHTRHYAKRQLTWFRKQEGFTWIPATNAVYTILSYLKD